MQAIGFFLTTAHRHSVWVKPLHTHKHTHTQRHPLFLVVRGAFPLSNLSPGVGGREFLHQSLPEIRRLGRMEVMQ